MQEERIEYVPILRSKKCSGFVAVQLLGSLWMTFHQRSLLRDVDNIARISGKALKIKGTPGRQ